jgi:signal transduction histidine kinase
MLSTKILVVEDSPEDREVYKRLIKQCGSGKFKIIEAASGEGGIEACRSERPACVLLDYQLPDLDGIEFMTKLLREPELPEIPVIMLTGQGSEQVAVEAMKLGARDYLVKGEISADALCRAVQNAIEKAALQNQLAEIQRELEQFAYVASHDLKSPLARVQMAVNMLEEHCDGELDGESHEMLAIISRSVEGMIELVTELLEYARAGGRDVTWETVNMRDVANRALENLEVQLADTKATVDIGELPSISGLRTGLTQLIQNLTGNALKFRSGEKPHIRISSELEEGDWHFRVEDNGIGIAAESQTDIFTPLKRLHSRTDYEGIGLGLATCMKIVHHHGGQIWVESEISKGATFHFTIPESEGHTPATGTDGSQ